MISDDEGGNNGKDDEKEVHSICYEFIKTHEHEEEGCNEEELEVVGQVPHLPDALFVEFPGVEVLNEEEIRPPVGFTVLDTHVVVGGSDRTLYHEGEEVDD